MRLLLKNGHESPLTVTAEPAGVSRSMAPGEELVVDWTWSGFADLTCGPEWLAFSVPAGGAITLGDPDPADVALWNGVPIPGGTAMREFWIHNATTVPVRTFWEPWCGEGDILPAGGPMRVEWTDRSTGAAMIYEEGFVIIWDCPGSCRAWQPDGEEVFTGGSYVKDPEDPNKYAPLPVPDWPS